MKRSRITIVSLIALTGCSLEPKYVRPEAPVAPQWPKGEAYPAAVENPLPAIRYQDIFADARLQALIARAIAGNQDLGIAVANMAAARAQYRGQRADLLPTVAAGGTATTSDPAPNSGGGGPDTRYNAQIGISAFEIDLFGRQRSLSRSAWQEYLASDAGMRATRLSLVAEVANAYFTLATDRSLLAITRETEDSAAKSVDLVRARYQGGIAPRGDLRQAETVLAQARSDHADLVTAVAQDRNAIELLIGGPVADAELPDSIESIADLMRELPAGMDSRILLRRPDVMEAEYHLRAANARIGAARAAFFPTISLTAAAGFASTALSSLFSNGAFSWSVAPSASLPIFDGGRNSANLAYAKAQRDLTLAQYKQAIQVAFREVADALAQRGTIDARLKAQHELEAAARDSDMLAEARYRTGIDTYLARLESQRTLYAARRSLASSRLLQAANRVALYQSLGGDMLLDGQAD